MVKSDFPHLCRLSLSIFHSQSVFQSPFYYLSFTVSLPQSFFQNLSFTIILSQYLSHNLSFTIFISISAKCWMHPCPLAGKLYYILGKFLSQANCLASHHSRKAGRLMQGALAFIRTPGSPSLAWVIQP